MGCKRPWRSPRKVWLLVLFHYRMTRELLWFPSFPLTPIVSALIFYKFSISWLWSSFFGSVNKNPGITIFTGWIWKLKIGCILITSILQAKKLELGEASVLALGTAVCRLDSDSRLSLRLQSLGRNPTLLPLGLFLGVQVNALSLVFLFILKTWSISLFLITCLFSATSPGKWLLLNSSLSDFYVSLAADEKQKATDLSAVISLFFKTMGHLPQDFLIEQGIRGAK